MSHRGFHKRIGSNPAIAGIETLCPGVKDQKGEGPYGGKDLDRGHLTEECIKENRLPQAKSLQRTVGAAFSSIYVRKTRTGQSEDPMNKPHESLQLV